MNLLLRVLFLSVFSASVAFGAPEKKSFVDQQSLIEESDRSSIALIPHGGIGALGYSGVQASGPIGIGRAVSPNFGAYVDIGKGPLVLETGLQFLTFAQSGTATVKFISAEATFSASRLVIPVQAKWMAIASSSGREGFFLKAGLNPSFKVSETISASVNGQSIGVNGQSIDDLKKNVISPKSFDLISSFGLGGGVGLGKSTSLVLEANYYYGLLNLYDSKVVIRNSGFLGNAGVAFEI